MAIRARIEAAERKKGPPKQDRIFIITEPKPGQFSVRVSQSRRIKYKPPNADNLNEAALWAYVIRYAKWHELDLSGLTDERLRQMLNDES